MLSAWARGTGQTGTRNTQAHVEKQPSVHKHTSTACTQTHHIKTETAVVWFCLWAAAPQQRRPFLYYSPLGHRVILAASDVKLSPNKHTYLPILYTLDSGCKHYSKNKIKPLFDSNVKKWSALMVKVEASTSTATCSFWLFKPIVLVLWPSHTMCSCLSHFLLHVHI